MYLYENPPLQEHLLHIMFDNLQQCNVVGFTVIHSKRGLDFNYVIRDADLNDFELVMYKKRKTNIGDGICNILGT